MPDDRANEPLSPREFDEAEGVEDWRLLGDGASSFYRVGTLADASRFVQAIVELPGIEERRPDIDLRRDGVTVRIATTTREHFGITRGDVEVARQISAVARRLSLSPDPSALQSLLIIPGAPRIADVVPFWRAVLGYEPRADNPDEDLVDPGDRGAPFWVEGMHEPRAGGGAIHVAVWVPYEEAEARVAVALAAGGRMVRDEFAPSWWTLADAAGNEADIATAKDRG